ncbi:hypothetical protein [Salinispira pacifica]|uniref:Uncharacterized protein n=1 Tax=Salinispira pacifica TaxID=1307761 RepID=V5WDG8_9SPIO|nr:hypothetical protein [Salinispira pacifica]AHC13863.1 hypothetical protein L21SP2_0431 [Salinispira pacifica]
MFFYESDIQQSIIEEFSLNTPGGRHEFYRELAGELERYPEDYRLFGPYWWFIKDQFRRREIRRKAWFHRSAPERSVLDETEGWPEEQLTAAALQYMRLMQEDPQPLLPGELQEHLWEDSDGCKMLAVEDPGLHRQPDLFEELEAQEHEKRDFLEKPEHFIPRIWKESGNGFMAQGDHFQAYRSFLRYLHIAEGESMKADAWLMTGLSLQNAGHHRKAVFAFNNAFERDSQDWILAHCADAHEGCSELARARELYQRLCSSMPGNPEYRQKLERLQSRMQSTPEPEKLNELPFHPLKRSLG